MKSAMVVSLSATRFQALALREDLEKNLELIQSLGFAGAELAIRNPAEIELQAVKAMLDRFHLEVPALGTGQAFVEEGLSLTSSDPDLRRQARERLVMHLELSAQLQALVIIGLIRGVPKKEEKDEALSMLAEELAGLCEKAQSLGAAGLILEPLNRYETSIINTVAEAAALIEKVGAKNLGILADSFHMNIEEKDLFESVVRAGSLVRHVHLADSNRWPPGQGHLDFDQFFAALDKIGYAAWVSGEYLPMPDPDQSVKLFADFLKAKKIS
jgi:sugar phosphate isomerase/epimerase